MKTKILATLCYTKSNQRYFQTLIDTANVSECHPSTTNTNRRKYWKPWTYFEGCKIPLKLDCTLDCPQQERPVFITAV